jgi:hypothetical protein
MLRGEAILLGTMVRFEAHGDGVYVGDGQKVGHRRNEHESYAFRFDSPADATVELVHLALMDATEWRVLRGSELQPSAAQPAAQ